MVDKSKRTKGFPYNTEDKREKELIDYLEKQPNQKAYILDLIEKDMNCQDIKVIIADEVKKYMQNFSMPLLKESINGNCDINTSDIFDIINME